MLAEVASMGYDGVEFAGYHGHSAEQIVKMLADNNLKCCGTHTGIDQLADDEFEETVEFNKAIGNRYIIVPGLPEEYRNTIDAWKKTAELFKKFAEKARGMDVRVGYHNHMIEFGEMDGECPWDVFFSGTDPEVIMQLDSGNAKCAGADITPFISKYPGRALTVHLKEWTGNPDGAVLGEGETDWQKIFDLCEGIGGTEWYIIEQEKYPIPPMDGARKCIENLKKIRGEG